MSETKYLDMTDLPMKLVRIRDANKDDIEYAQKLLESANDIKQLDLRDNMDIIETNKEGTCVILRSAKLEREYQAWQEEVRRKSDET